LQHLRARRLILLRLFEHSKALPLLVPAPWGFAISGSATITITFFAPVRALMLQQPISSKIQSAPATRENGRSLDRSSLSGRTCDLLRSPSSRPGRSPCSSGFTPLLFLYSCLTPLSLSLRHHVAAGLPRCSFFCAPLAPPPATQILRTKILSISPQFILLDTKRRGRLQLHPSAILVFKVPVSLNRDGASWSGGLVLNDRSRFNHRGSQQQLVFEWS